MLSPALLALALLPLLDDAAEGDASGTTDNPSMLPVFVAIAAVFWFVMILPERKNRKRREELLGALEKGDKVLMKSGLYGTISRVADDTITLQVADGVRMKFAREAVQSLADESAAADKSESKGSSK
ncbi:MAG: preprotein translocase subunit YajC [bacterium]|jgi:preprotein translocase subunit YajC